NSEEIDLCTRPHSRNRTELPSLAKEGAKREPDRAKHQEMLRHQENGPLPLKARPGWFVQQPIIGGLTQPPRLRPLRRLRGILLIGAATPPWPRRGVSRAQKSRQKNKKMKILLHKLPIILILYFAVAFSLVSV